MAPVRRRVRAPGLPRPRAQRRRRGAREHHLLRQSRRHPRHRRVADVQGLAPPRLADPRAVLLQVARALMARRTADLREPPRGERGPVRALSAQERACREDPVQRDGQRAPPGPAHAPAPELHRRPERRPGQGLVPDRARSVPGAEGDQAGQARRDHGDGDLEALRLRAVERTADLHEGADQPADRGVPQDRRPAARAGQQVRQCVHRCGRRLGPDRNDHQLRQLLRHRPLLGLRDLLESRVLRPLTHRRPLPQRRRADRATACGLSCRPAPAARPRSIRRRRTATACACPASASTPSGGSWPRG